MQNEMIALTQKIRKQKGLAAFTAFGITMLLLAGCGQSSTNKIGDQPDTDSVNVAPVNSTDATNKTSDKEKDNPFAAAGINDPDAFIKMYKATQNAVAANEKETVAELVLYPLHVNGEPPMEISSKAEFVEKYDDIMTQTVRNALAVQKVETLFVRDQGVMVGEGELWFGASAEEPQAYGIIAVNPEVSTNK